MQGGDQKRLSQLSVLLQASYTLIGSQDGLSHLLKASYTIVGGKNGLSKLLRSPNIVYGR